MKIKVTRTHHTKMKNGHKQTDTTRQQISAHTSARHKSYHLLNGPTKTKKRRQNYIIKGHKIHKRIVTNQLIVNKRIIRMF